MQYHEQIIMDIFKLFKGEVKFAFSEVFLLYRFWRIEAAACNPLKSRLWTRPLTEAGY